MSDELLDAAADLLAHCHQRDPGHEDPEAAARHREWNARMKRLHDALANTTPRATHSEHKPQVCSVEQHK